MTEIEAPKNGVRIRMYRQGHGDCFLLTLRQDDGEPFNILIDCGLKPGSEIKVPVEAVIENIREATGGRIDVLVVTHEHQDHVNLFLAKVDGETLFDRVRVEALWLGWTADPKDPLASEVRKGHKKAVEALAAARQRLSLSPEGVALAREIDDLLAFEGFGATQPPVKFDSTATIPRSVAEAMEYLSGRVKDKNTKYFRPHQMPHTVAGLEGVRFFSLGPPRSKPQLNQDEPGDSDGAGRLYEKPGDGHGLSFAFGDALDGLLADGGHDDAHPFTENRRLTRESPEWARHARYFDHFYPPEEDDQADGKWRRVDDDWLFATEWFARKINVEVNNSSLVLAIELPKSGKVLLFPGDAQYGNWLSWSEKAIPLGDGTDLPVKDLLARTVFYKVGHHGSHNATLKGTPDSDYPNLGWLGQGDLAKEFVAVIPANEVWAYDQITERTPDGWQHPLRAIRSALEAKTGGRLFQSNIDFVDMKRVGSSAADWNRFAKRADGSDGQDLYFDYWIPDE